MDRRSFLGAGAAAAAGSALGQALPRQAWAAEPEHEWKMVLAWPKKHTSNKTATLPSGPKYVNCALGLDAAGARDTRK